MRATPLLFPAAGVAQYIRCLARELLAAGENLTLFTPFRWGVGSGARQSRCAGGGRRCAGRCSAPCRAPGRRQGTSRSALLALNRELHRVALYHEPAALPLPFRGPTVVTVHDLSWIRFPETHPADRVATLNRRFPARSIAPSHVIADSEFTRREIIEVFGTRAGQDFDHASRRPRRASGPASRRSARPTGRARPELTAASCSVSEHSNPARTSKPSSAPTLRCPSLPAGVSARAGRREGMADLRPRTGAPAAGRQGTCAPLGLRLGRSAGDAVFAAPTYSSIRRCTKASGCRRWRRWPAGHR